MESNNSHDRNKKPAPPYFNNVIGGDKVRIALENGYRPDGVIHIVRLNCGYGHVDSNVESISNGNNCIKACSQCLDNFLRRVASVLHDTPPTLFVTHEGALSKDSGIPGFPPSWAEKFGESDKGIFATVGGTEFWWDYDKGCWLCYDTNALDICQKLGIKFIPAGHE